jgi:type III secretion protein J
MTRADLARFAKRLLPLTLLVMLTACKVDLYASLSEAEANQILAALVTEGIDASKEHVGETGWTVKVDESDLPTALEILRTDGLPAERFSSLGQVFQKQGLVATPTEERMRYIFAISQELSETLRQIEGVVSARVHVVIPATDPLSDRVKPSSAAVFIKHRPEADLRLLVPAVKDLVAHSIEGIQHDNVSLTLIEARPYAPAARSQAAQAAGNGFPVGRVATVAGIVILALITGILAWTLWRRGGVRWARGARDRLQSRLGS